MKNLPFAKYPFTANEQTLISMERVLSDIRRGVPVVLTGDNGNAVLVSAVEAIGAKELKRLYSIAPAKAALVLSQKRAAFLFPLLTHTNHIHIAGPFGLAAIQALSGLAPLEEATQDLSYIPATPLDGKALELAKLAELMPAVILVPSDNGSAYAAANNLLAVTTEQVAAYQEAASLAMEEICRAPLCLEGAEEAAIIAYRAVGSGREHYAIIIGKPDRNAPLVRVHSSCYTGDLLGSLHCDCGDQLRTAIQFMAAHEGGIILYLMQEGRGIGLVNKLRTYALQATGIDTVDANEMLGFDDDERLFLPAAKMLELLEISCVKLLTNNPRKAKGLESYGLKVMECVPHVMQPHQHNEAYLKTKAARLGHHLPTTE